MPAFGFVADDLTGAADVLAQSHRYGLDAALVIGDAPLPTDTDVVGFAGPARSLSGTAFDNLVIRDLAGIAALNLDVLLYKVCSTFDSSTTVGSIGRGIQLLHQQFPLHGPIPVAPAQPGFGRYTAFSNHYANYAGKTYRLDRHPVMSRHPSTPWPRRTCARSWPNSSAAPRCLRRSICQPMRTALSRTPGRNGAGISGPRLLSLTPWTNTRWMPSQKP